MSGRLIAVVGPSGAGKDTLIQGARAQRPGLGMVRRVITRPAEAGGEDFEASSETGFDIRRRAGEFALDWRAHGLCYGIPKLALVPLERGEVLLFNGSRAALAEAAARFPGLGVILITAPPEVLAARLAARGREDAADRAARVRRAALALPADLPPGLALEEVVNDCAAETAVQRFLAALDRLSPRGQPAPAASAPDSPRA